MLTTSFHRAIRHTTSAIVAAAALSVGSVALAEKTQLNVASPLPANHSLNKAIHTWLDSLAVASKGEIEFKWYPGEVIAKSTKALASVKNGLVDASYVIDSYTSSELPYQITASKNGAMGEDAMVMTGAANEYMLLNCPECKRDWEKNGVMAMVHVSTTPYYVACRERLDTADKLRGRKIRAPGSFGAVATEFGSVPVNIPITDTYEALQRGQVDCTFSAAAHLKAYSFNEVVKFMVTAPFGVYMSGTPLLMNKNKWASLPAAHRDLIRSRLASLATQSVMAYLNEAELARKDSEAKGVTWVAADPSLLEARQRYLDRLVDVAEQEGQKRRITGVKDMMDRFSPIHEKWKNIVKQIDHDPAKFEQALQLEVFDKLSF